MPNGEECFNNMHLYEAEELAKSKGAVSKGEYQVRNNWTGYYETMFVHFFNVRGAEIGYTTIPLKTLTFFATPRVWDGKFKESLKISVL
jgi:hypothetical protein